jgi:DNA-binding GntR family transcriptional regulator
MRPGVREERILATTSSTTSSATSSTTNSTTGGPGDAGTLSDEVYRRLRSAIVRGEHRPNARLIEAELAEQLEVSRTPVRDGLLRLASDGLVLSRRRGWVVREHTPDEISEIYGVRTALEGYAARLAATAADDAAIERIAEVHRRGTRDVHRGARERLVEYNDTFHDAVIAAAGNRRLADLIRQNREYYFNHRIAALYSDDEASLSIAGHDELVRAIVARDGDAAEAAARAHVAEALTVILAKIA